MPIFVPLFNEEKKHSHHQLAKNHCQRLQSDCKWLHSLESPSQFHQPEKQKIPLIKLSTEMTVLPLENGRGCVIWDWLNVALTLSVSCRTATSKRMYSIAAFSVSTLLGLRSGLISGTMCFKRENMVFKFLICTDDILKFHVTWTDTKQSINLATFHQTLSPLHTGKQHLAILEWEMKLL